MNIRPNPNPDDIEYARCCFTCRHCKAVKENESSHYIEYACKKHSTFVMPFQVCRKFVSEDKYQ